MNGSKSLIVKLKISPSVLAQYISKTNDNSIAASSEVRNSGDDSCIAVLRGQPFLNPMPLPPRRCVCYRNNVILSTCPDMEDFVIPQRQTADSNNPVEREVVKYRPVEKPIPSPTIVSKPVKKRGRYNCGTNYTPQEDSEQSYKLRKVACASLKRRLGLDVLPGKVSFSSKPLKPPRTVPYVWDENPDPPINASDEEEDVLSRTIFSHENTAGRRSRRTVSVWTDDEKRILADMIMKEQLIPVRYALGYCKYHQKAPEGDEDTMSHDIITENEVLGTGEDHEEEDEGEEDEYEDLIGSDQDIRRKRLRLDSPLDIPNTIARRSPGLAAGMQSVSKSQFNASDISFASRSQVRTQRNMEVTSFSVPQSTRDIIEIYDDTSGTEHVESRSGTVESQESSKFNTSPFEGISISNILEFLRKSVRQIEGQKNELIRHCSSLENKTWIQDKEIDIVKCRSARFEALFNKASDCLEAEKRSSSLYKNQLVLKDARIKELETVEAEKDGNLTIAYNQIKEKDQVISKHASLLEFHEKEKREYGAKLERATSEFNREKAKLQEELQALQTGDARFRTEMVPIMSMSSLLPLQTSKSSFI